MSSSQSEKWLMFSNREYRIRPIRIANDAFSSVRKIIHPIKSHRGVWVLHQNSCLLEPLEVCGAVLCRHSPKKFFCKKVKNILEIGILSCISLPMKRTVESQLNNSRRGKTERKWFKRKRQKFKLLFLLRRNVGDCCLPAVFFDLLTCWHVQFSKYLPSIFSP